MATSRKFYLLGCDTKLSPENTADSSEEYQQISTTLHVKTSQKAEFFSYFHYELPNPVIDQKPSLT
jgi:hypothetical protein